MKKNMRLYESCKLPIRVAYFGFILIAIGFLIRNESVNVFYTFRSGPVLFIADMFLKIGEFTIMNLPLIFMLNIVCKKANNASPIVMALVGYFTFAVTTMYLSNQNLNAQAYMSGYGINSLLNTTTGARYPLETGLIGALLVGYMTRVSFIFSRHRGSFSLANIFSRETSGLVYNVLGCFLLGVLFSYVYPFVYTYIQSAITFISEDLFDPLRLGLYTVLDRALSILGLGNVIRYPFWYTSLGGSFSNTVTGQSVLGDVNIWRYLQESNATYVGAGRFITPYYVINMFVIPGFYLGTLYSMSDKHDRAYLTLTFLFAIIISIIAGNPLPAELLMLFSTPLLLVMYLLLVGIVAGLLVSLDAFLGFSSNITNTVIAMPGSFPDYIINIRNPGLGHSLQIILLVGVAAFIISLLMTLAYYRYFAYDFIRTSEGEKLVGDIIAACGGKENIRYVGSGLFEINIYINDPDKIVVQAIHDLQFDRVVETREGLSFEVGSSCSALARRIRKKLKRSRK